MTIAGIDIGTSGLKVSIFDMDGKVLYSTRRKYSEIREHGFRELRPDVIAEHTFSALSESSLNTGQEIAAITVASLGESLVFLDHNDCILCNSMVTGDIRGIEQAAYIEETYGKQKIMEITGLTPNEMYTLPKLLWLQQNTSLLQKASKLFFFEDYISYLLTGERKVSYTSAARSMAFDIRQKKWDDKLLALSSLDPSQFSDPVAPGTIIGTVIPKIASQLHLSPNVIVTAGGHDQSMAALGSALIDTSLAEDGHGTCEFLSVMLPERFDLEVMTAQDLPCSPYVFPDHYLTGIEITTCGALMNWARSTIFSSLCRESEKYNADFFEYMDQQASRITTNVCLLPQFGSSGNPDINYNVSGSITGLTLHTTLPELYRGIKESLAFQMRYSYETAQKSGITMKKIVLTGGGAHSDLTAHIRADIFQLPVSRLSCSEAGAMGCMILSAVALGIYPDIKTCAKQVVRFSDEIAPAPELQAYYDEKYQRFKYLYQAMHDPRY